MNSSNLSKCTSVPLFKDCNCNRVSLNVPQVTCATLAGGFWGNHVLHSGVMEFEKATENINSIVKRSQEMTRRYNEVLQKNIEQVMWGVP